MNDSGAVPVAGATVRLPPAVVAALRAWADLDRFGLPDVPRDGADGWAAVGELSGEGVPAQWPPRPERTPAGRDKVLDTRIMFGCLNVHTLEDLLDRLFSDDQRFVQTSVRPPRRPPSRPSRLEPQTCRGAFRVDAEGDLVPDSFEYAPLIDFARHVEHYLGQDRSLRAAVADALAAIQNREAGLLDSFQDVAESGSGGFEAVDRVLRRVRVQGDSVRYVSQWIGPDAEPTGQLPAFFRGDLLRAADRPTSPLAAAFLAGRPGARAPGFADVSAGPVLEPLLSPGRIPRAAWPAGHPPRLSQQVALTAILADDASPVLAVNGPPGTGKTTMLRDLYANLVTRRAAVLVTFDEPQSAFAAARDVASMNARRWTLFRPDPRICGFEMLVASSNNAAVENITKELPDVDRVAGAAVTRLGYFTAAANEDPAGGDPEADGYRPGLLRQPHRAWGFAAAALGSRSRVGAFQTVVDRYLKHGTGTSLLELLGRRPATGEWRAARERFGRAQRAVDAAIARIETALAARTELDDRLSASDGLRATRIAWDAAEAEAAAEVQAARGEASRFDRASEAARLASDQHRENRPGWLARRATKDSWKQTQARLEEAAADAGRAYAARVEVLKRRCAALAAARESSGRATQQETLNSRRITELQSLIDAAPTPGHGPASWITHEWWERRGVENLRADLELSPAWIDPQLQLLREELFAAAMHVHEVFARSCGQQFRANLWTWMGLQSNEIQHVAADEVTLDAWRSLFLLVPLVSTTFASVARLLSRVPLGSLGWLIVDEAGQAVPAAAVGALARCRRAVVVGDPLQLEPVVTLPRALIDQLMSHHGAPEDLAPTRTSVQTMADAVCPYGVRLGEETISLPLLVHNRCLDPMFTISNTMAYDGRMVQGRTRSSGAPPELGPSRWIDSKRSSADTTHYLERDWWIVRELLSRLDWPARLPARGPVELAAPEVPSVAIISPFKQVTGKLEMLVPGAIRSFTTTLTPDERDQLAYSVRVGTVHTFQGREHNVIILVLGGATPGSRAWAAGTPNLLNVAVTRAKDRLIVIGDRAAWRSVGVARTLADGLPVTTE